MFELFHISLVSPLLLFIFFPTFVPRNLAFPGTDPSMPLPQFLDLFSIRYIESVKDILAT